MLLVKIELDKYLYSLLGREDLVERWWHSKNIAFNNQSPYSVYQSGEEGRKQVNDYILRYCYYD